MSSAEELHLKMSSLEQRLDTLTRELNEDKQELKSSMEKSKIKDDEFKEKVTKKLDEISLTQSKRVGFISGIAAFATLLTTVVGLVIAAINGKVF